MHNKPEIERTNGHIQSESGDSGFHCLRTYHLVTDIYDDGKPQEWNLALRMPRYVAEVIGREDWEKTERLLDTRTNPNDYSVAEFVVITGVLFGATSQQVSDRLGKLMSENLYRVFCQKQIKMGNKAWVVPSSMQRVSKDGFN